MDRGDHLARQALALERAQSFAEAGEMWERAGDLEKALRCYQRGNRIDEAAHLLKISGRGAAAAKLYAAAGEHGKAAAIYEEIFEFVAAGAELVQSGDKARAAAMFEQGDAFEDAARLYVELGNLRKAAQLYLHADQPQRAAELNQRAALGTTVQELPPLPEAGVVGASQVVETVARLLRAGRTDDAARLYAGCQESIGYPVLAAIAGDLEAERCAAEMLVCANDFAMAAQLFENLGDFQSAAAMFERGDDPYLAAEMFLRLGDQQQAARLYEKSGHFRQAAERYSAVGNHDAAAACYQRSGDHLLAGKLFAFTHNLAKALAELQKVRKGDPGFAEASQLVAQALAQSGHADLADQRRSEHTEVVSLMDGFEFIQSAPLFRDLSLEELKMVHDHCETRRFEAGQVLIEQDQASSGLLVLRRGTARVVRVGPHRQEELLARLGPGSPVGEMSLVDDSPTSARVVAESEVKAFHISREKFAQLLASSDAMALKLYRFFAFTLAKRLRVTSKHVATK